MLTMAKDDARTLNTCIAQIMLVNLQLLFMAKIRNCEKRFQLGDRL